MAYSIKHPSADLTRSLRRIATSQIEAGLEDIEDPGLSRAESIHQARKRCKKLRGLIRLVRPGFADYSEENKAFRDLGRLLSDTRDATASIETLDALETRFEAAMAGDIFSAVRKALTARLEALDDSEIADRLETMRKGLAKAAKRVPDWEVEGDDAAILADGIAKTHGRAVEAMHTAADTGRADDFHEWRKRVKYHWYHLRLLKRTWPELFESWVAAADRLSDDLGDHHDLAVFRSETLPDIDAGSETSREALEGLMRAEQARLESESLARGQLLFAEAPEAAGARLASYWQAWREPLVPASGQ